MAQASGIGTYIRGLLGAFSACRPASLTLTLITGKDDGVDGDWTRIPLSARFYSPSEQVAVPWAFRRSGAKLLHSPHYNLPVVLASRCVVTVHDLIHLKFPQFLPSRLAWIYAQSVFRQWIPRARAILTVSENTKKDLIETLGIPESKITVTPPGVPDGFHPLAPADYQPALESLKLPKGYFLYVGNLKEFKNVPRLLEAYRRLRQKKMYAPPMVFVGENFIPGFDRELENTPYVRWFPDLDRGALPAVYAGALALVFPSLYEGFGLPPLEAMACGTPVICSNRASLPEVVGDAALQVDPLSLDDLVNAMKRLCEDTALAGVLSAKGLQRAAQFTWDTTAAKTLDVYRRCS
ncbi:MAG: hypothetical protein A2992_09850 [Elusimicrobia bacterium RIFCSPLOWO2_01_FULL_59_12]|nr:MAG: hypothetical protein A2992_09850 [Elusimicrobia bacterium RIFCSPLOWO2_01_FULL_59_12]